MAGPNAVEDLSALVGQGDVELSPIITTQASFDEAVSFHPVQQAGEPTSTQLIAGDHGGDQVAHGQHAILGPGQMHQDIELFEGQVLLGQVVGEAAHDETRRPLQIPPGRKAFVVSDAAGNQVSLLSAIGLRQVRLRGWAS